MAAVALLDIVLVIGAQAAFQALNVIPLALHLIPSSPRLEY
jgi:hypothetical protein